MLDTSVHIFYVKYIQSTNINTNTGNAKLEILINDTYFKNILSNAKKNFRFILMLLLLDLKIQPPLIRKQETPTFKAISRTREILQKLLR